MSQYGYENDDLDQNFGQQTQEPAKGLRKQLEDLAAKLNERDAQIAELTKTVRTRTVIDTLTELKVPNAGKVAKLVPTEIAGDVEKVKGWVTEYGDVFAASASSEASGQKPEADEQQSGHPDVDAATIAGFQRTQTSEASAGSTTPDIEAQHAAQLTAMFQAANGSSDTFFSLLEKGGLNS
jgi:hypothetical protein